MLPNRGRGSKRRRALTSSSSTSCSYAILLLNFDKKQKMSIIRWFDRNKNKKTPKRIIHKNASI